MIPARTMCPLGYEAEVTTGRATNRCQTGKSRRGRGVLGYDTDPHGPCLARGAAIA